MVLSVVPIDEAGIQNIADDISGFLDPDEAKLADSMSTTLFITAGNEKTKGRNAYLLMDDGSQLYVPNALRCWLVDVQLVTQTYSDYPPVEKLLVKVVASDGSHYTYRCGADSWTASSLLLNFKHMSRKQLSDQITITLNSKGRCVFANVEFCEAGAFHRVDIPKSEFGNGKLTYDQLLDCISWANNTAQSVEDSGVIEAQVEPDDEPFDTPPDELDQVLEDIRSPKQRRRKSASRAEEPTTA
jgi:hypothetical protein